MAKVPFWKRKGKAAAAETAGPAEGLPEDLSENLDPPPDAAAGSFSGFSAQAETGQEMADELEPEGESEVSDKKQFGNPDESEEEAALNGFGDSADEAAPAPADLHAEHSQTEAEASESDDPVAILSAEYEQEITKLQAEIRENYDKYLRALAEGENIKKRALKDRADVLKYAGESLARDILEVIDDLENAVTQGGGVTSYTKESFDSIITGFKLVFDKFRSILERHGIKGESAVGQQLDPKKHEALAAVPSADAPPGQVMNEFRKAYFFKDKLLRAGQVVVAAALPAADENSAEQPAEAEESET